MLTFHRKSWRGAQCLFFLLLSVLSYNLDRHTPYLQGVRTSLVEVIIPIQSLTDWFVRQVGLLVAGPKHYQQILRENDKLRSHVLILRHQLNQTAALQQENASLRALLQATQSYQLTSPQVAQVLAIDGEPLTHWFRLNKGQMHGIQIGQPVFDAYGVLGHIVRVQQKTSEVMLITDYRSAIPVQNARTGHFGIAMGSASDRLKLINVSVVEDVMVGDLYVTSGLGGRYLQGYPIGTIAQVVKHTGTGFAAIELKPKAQFNRAHLVLVDQEAPT